MDDLENAIKYIGRDKARDALGMVNGLFKEEAAGTNFKLAILKLMYLIKNKSEFPKVMDLCNITSIYKNKGSHKDFDSYCGVFSVTELRSILDITLSTRISQMEMVGPERERNIGDNINVMNSISNSVINGKMPLIQISVTDVKNFLIGCG